VPVIHATLWAKTDRPSLRDRLMHVAAWRIIWACSRIREESVSWRMLSEKARVIYRGHQGLPLFIGEGFPSMEKKSRMPGHELGVNYKR